MKKKSRFILVGCLAAMFIPITITYGGADAWKNKKYSEWTNQEAIQVISRSPWANTETVVTGMAGMSGQSGPTGMAQRPGNQSMGEDLNTTLYSIAWYSSIPVREAHARLATLNNRATEEQLKQFLQPVTDVCLISIKGVDLKPFLDANKESVLKKTYLLVKGKEKVFATDYTPPESARSGMALFQFPRNINGAPLFNENDKEVEFGTDLSGIRIRSRFSPKKMVFEGAFTY